MTTIFKEISELRNFITLDVSSDLDVMMPYLKQAEKYVRGIVGDPLFDILIEFVNTGTFAGYSENNYITYPIKQLYLSDFENIDGWDIEIYPTLFFQYSPMNTFAYIYSDEARTNKVAQYEGTGNVTITEVNLSGINGSITSNNMMGDPYLITVLKRKNTGTVIEILLPYCQLALANFAYWLSIDKLNVNIGNAGITVASTASLVPASKERIDRLRENLKLSAYDALEELIKFLEKNVDDFSEWKSSEAYSYNKQFFINNANEFYKTIHKQITRLQFLAIKEFIALAEIEIKGVVCNDLFAELKSEILSGEISTKNLVLLEFIKPAVCYLSLNKQEENIHYRNEAASLIEELRLFLNANADDYPLYLNSNCCSSSAKANLNDDESGFFTFGL